MDEHDLISQLKGLAQELGTTPTRGQYLKHCGKGGHKYIKYWINWNDFVNAAGLAPNHERKITNKIFERNIETHLESYEPKKDIEHPPYPTIGIWSDLHRPFINKKVEARVLEYVGDVKPEWFFENGDGDDQLSHSKFPRSHNIFTPREERDLCRKQHVEFWAEARRRSPLTKFKKMLGNHDIRPIKRILESYPEGEDWIIEGLRRDYSYDGVETIFDHREEVIIGDIAIFHGYRGKLGDHRDFTLMNCINGHSHVGGAVFRRIRGQTIWELNTGLSGDPEAKGLTYTPQKITNWTPGFGSVDVKGPRFYPV